MQRANVQQANMQQANMQQANVQQTKMLMEQEAKFGDTSKLNDTHQTIPPTICLPEL